MHERTQNLHELWDRFKDLYAEMLAELMNTTDDMKAKRLKNEDLADIGFICREMKSLADDFRKDCKAREELAGKIIAYVVTSASLNDLGSSADSVRGELATAIPDVKQVPKLPQKGSAPFVALCRELGIPQETIDQGLVKIDWKEAVEVATERMQDGLPAPPGLGETYPDFKCVFRRRNKR